MFHPCLSIGCVHRWTVTVFENLRFWKRDNIHACINRFTSLPTIRCLVWASTCLFYFEPEPKNEARKEGRIVGEEFGPVHGIPQCSFLPVILNKKNMQAEITTRVNKRSVQHGILQFINKQTGTEVIIFEYFVVFLIKCSMFSTVKSRLKHSTCWTPKKNIGYKMPD